MILLIFRMIPIAMLASVGMFLQHLRCCEGDSFFYAVMFALSGEYCTLTPLRVFIVTSQFGIVRFSGMEIEHMLW